SQRGVELRLGWDESDITDERLHDHGREIRAPPLKHLLDGRHVVERYRQRESRDARRDAGAVRETQRRDAGTGLHEKAVTMPVVAAVELQDQVATPRGAGHPPGGHRRLGAAVDEA